LHATRSRARQQPVRAPNQLRLTTVAVARRQRLNASGARRGANLDAHRTLQPFGLGRLARVALLAALGLLALLALPRAAPAQQGLVTGLTGPDQYQSGDP